MVFHPDNSNIILAAGWSERVIFWDIRTGNPERSIVGPHIRGQGLDIYNDIIMTVSAREKKQVEIWDFGTAKKISDFSVEPLHAGTQSIGSSVKIANNGTSAIIGTSGTNLGYAIDMQQLQTIGQTSSYRSPVISCNLSPFGSSLFIGTESGEAECYMIRVLPNL